MYPFEKLHFSNYCSVEKKFPTNNALFRFSNVDWIVVIVLWAYMDRNQIYMYNSDSEFKIRIRIKAG